MTPPRTVLRIDADELAQAVLEALDSHGTTARYAFAAAVVERAKARASLDVDFELEKKP